MAKRYPLTVRRRRTATTDAQAIKIGNMIYVPGQLSQYDKGAMIVCGTLDN